jgi:GT2 family glycosyltransferase
LGQFDEWREVPSACFAAALITREGWQTIGPMDENFPFYYEDVEWSYRARLFGYKIGFAPNSIVYHGFGGGAPGDEAGVISPRKLFHIVYGRYRFTLKLLSRYRMTSLWNYIFFDSTRFLKALFQGKLPVVEVYFRAWMKIMREIFSIRKQHREILKRRVMDDECLFKIQADYPKASLRKGLPDLSLNRIRLHYLPLIEAKKTRGILEMEYAADVDRVSPPHSGL